MLPKVWLQDKSNEEIKYVGYIDRIRSCISFHKDSRCVPSSRPPLSCCESFKAPS